MGWFRNKEYGKVVVVVSEVGGKVVGWGMTVREFRELLIDALHYKGDVRGYMASEIVFRGEDTKLVEWADIVTFASERRIVDMLELVEFEYGGMGLWDKIRDWLSWIGRASRVEFRVKGGRK